MVSTPQRKQLTRDQRIQIRTLHDIGFTHEQIAIQLRVTVRQVQYALSFERYTPRKRAGRPPFLDHDQIQHLIDFVCESKTHRLLSFRQLAALWPGNGTEYSIRYALRKAGFNRRIARAKPSLSDVNKTERYNWALEHLEWTRAQWETILWTDETWVTGGRHTRLWVTRRPGEELNPTCVVEKIRKKRGWMFWGCFNGSTKGPGLFWEKEWGTINKTTYCERIVPIIHGWIRMNPRLQLMQDGAPGHSAAETKAELAERGIFTIFWPAYSPDLNPIETIWNWMKDYIYRTYEDVHLSYERLRVAVREAWDSITEAQLNDLLDSMPERCRDVKDALGGFTKW